MLPSHVGRYVQGVAFVLAPLLILVIPPLLNPTLANAETAEQQLRMLAQQGGSASAAFFVQAVGAAALVPTGVGVWRVAQERGRGMVAAGVGAVLAFLGAFGLVLAIGAEMSQAFFVINGQDLDEVIRLALAMNATAWFSLALLGGLVAFMLSLPVLAIALWRTRALELPMLLLFLLPIVASVLPLTGELSNLAPGVALVIACGGAARGVMRGGQVTSERHQPIVVS